MPDMSYRISGRTPMKKHRINRQSPEETLRELRNRIRGGSNIQLDKLSDEELQAAREMIFNDEAEIVSAACKPFLVAKLDKFIIS